MEDVTFKDLLNLVDRHEELRRTMTIENDKLKSSNKLLKSISENALRLTTEVNKSLAIKDIEIARLQAIIKTEAELHTHTQGKELR